MAETEAAVVDKNLEAVMNKSKFALQMSIFISCFLVITARGQPIEADILLNTVPANIFVESSGLQETIRFPNYDNDVTALVRCETLITSRGRYKNTACYQELEANWRFENAILRAAPNASAVPAVVHGESRDIWTIFSVLFIRRNGNEAITLYPNHLLSFEKYGDEYIAPQQYYWGDGWPHCGGSGNMLLEHTVHVDGSVDTVHVEGVSETCGERIANYFPHTRYIPATLDGEPIEVTFREWIFFR